MKLREETEEELDRYLSFVNLKYTTAKKSAADNLLELFQEKMLEMVGEDSTRNHTAKLDGDKREAMGYNNAKDEIRERIKKLTEKK